MYCNNNLYEVDTVANFDDIFNKTKNMNFDEVINKTKNVAEELSKRSATALEISRRKIELLDNKNKLSRVYENYGYLIYKQKNGEEVNQVDIDVKEEEISLLRNKIDVLSGELEEYKQNNKF